MRGVAVGVHIFVQNCSGSEKIKILSISRTVGKLGLQVHIFSHVCKTSISISGSEKIKILSIFRKKSSYMNLEINKQLFSTWNQRMQIPTNRGKTGIRGKNFNILRPMLVKLVCGLQEVEVDTIKKAYCLWWGAGDKLCYKSSVVQFLKLLTQ